jgi:hypothetical protein
MDNQLEFGFLEEKIPEETTVAELQALIKLLVEKREEIDEQKKVLSALNVVKDELEARVEKILEAQQLLKFHAGSHTVSISERSTYTFPKDPENAEMTRQYLIDNGMVSMLQVNSATWNAFMNSRKKECEERGEPEQNALIPGVDGPTKMTILSLRKGK